MQRRLAAGAEFAPCVMDERLQGPVGLVDGDLRPEARQHHDDRRVAFTFKRDPATLEQLDAEDHAMKLSRAIAATGCRV